MAPVLHMIGPSPPVRSVQITAKAIGLQLQEKPVNILKGEHLTPEYLKLNPQHTVPTLVDDGFSVWDSHAINAYLVSKYAKNDSLYPKDLKKRAIVDQRLHFDSGVAFGAVVKIMGPILRGTKTSLDDSDSETINQVYDFLESFLDGKAWAAGDSLTIADYNLYATISALKSFTPFGAQKHGKVAAWFKKVEALPEVEVSKKGLADFEALWKSKLNC